MISHLTHTTTCPQCSQPTGLFVQASAASTAAVAQLERVRVCLRTQFIKRATPRSGLYVRCEGTRAERGTSVCFYFGGLDAKCGCVHGCRLNRNVCPFDPIRTGKGYRQPERRDQQEHGP